MSQPATRAAGYSFQREMEFYYFKQDGIWYLNIPGCGLANLGNHQIVEHEDGSITASPSILTTGKTTRHGYLKQGVWEDC